MGKKEARKAARALLASTPYEDAPKPKVAAKPLLEALEEFLLMRKGMLAEGTQRFIRFCVLRWLHGAHWERWGDISPESTQRGFIAVLKAIKAGDLEPKYWSSVRCYAIEFFGYAVEVGYLSGNPVKGLPAPRKSSFRKDPVTWSQDEFEAIHGSLEPFLAMQLWLMRYTGMDLADLAVLSRQHIIRDSEGEWMIRKPRKKEERFEEAVILLPLNDYVEDIVLEAYRKTREADELLFPGIHLGVDGGHSLLYARARRRWYRLYPGKKFKCPKKLRHTFSSWAINELRIPLNVVQDWLGHSPRSTVLRERYLDRGSTARFARMLQPVVS
jgi:integrase